MTRLAREDGFTLVELLFAAMIMIVVLLATLSVADSFVGTDRRNQSQSDAQASLRAVTDNLAWELRNVSAPGKQSGFERATATDLVFDTIDPWGPDGGSNTYSLSRVRYCLDKSVSTNQKLWRQVQTWTTASPPALASPQSCPDFTWNHTPRILLQHVTNSASQPLFSYDTSTTAAIGQVITDLFVDANPGHPPGSSELRTSVFERNTNRPPTAGMTATPLGNKQVLLNGGGSTDPEGQQLKYYWQDGSTYIGCSGTPPCSGSATFTYTAATTGSHTFTLTVVDPSGQSATATQTVNVT